MKPANTRPRLVSLYTSSHAEAAKREVEALIQERDEYKARAEKAEKACDEYRHTAEHLSDLMQSAERDWQEGNRENEP